MLQVRIPDDLVRRIDALRGLVPRETWIRAVLEGVVERQEGAPERHGVVAETNVRLPITEDDERELAHKIAQLRVENVPWDGSGGIVARGLVSSATKGRSLLRKYRLDAKSGGPVEIADSYDRFEIDPKTGLRKGYRPKRS